MAYTELIKNFERIRDYMREFYVYGFKSREEYDRKSPRSYDNERRRIESYLGDYMGFQSTPSGRRVFLSLDSRRLPHNPLYQAWKAKSFTDGDITLHFILLDLLHDPDASLALSDIMDGLDEYVSAFPSPEMFDESTVRKKLKEYEALGLIRKGKQGKQAVYSRTEKAGLSGLREVLEFFSEAGLCGVIGSFLLDREPEAPSPFSFKHHYMLTALDSEILCGLLEAISETCYVELQNRSRAAEEARTWKVLPLKIFISVQNGRQYLLGYTPKLKEICSYRLDHILRVKKEEPAADFALYRARLSEMQKHMWGVMCRRGKRLEHVEFTVSIGKNEEYIYRRLEREKRCGTVERLDPHTCRFTAKVYDTVEMLPWIRTFTGRLLSLNFSNRTVENQLKRDMEELYRMYGMGGES